MWSIHGENLAQYLAHYKDSIQVNYNLACISRAVILQALADEGQPLAIVLT